MFEYRPSQTLAVLVVATMTCVTGCGGFAADSATTTAPPADAVAAASLAAQNASLVEAFELVERDVVALEVAVEQLEAALIEAELDSRPAATGAGDDRTAAAVMGRVGDVVSAVTGSFAEAFDPGVAQSISGAVTDMMEDATGTDIVALIEPYLSAARVDVAAAARTAARSVAGADIDPTTAASAAQALDALAGALDDPSLSAAAAVEQFQAAALAQTAADLRVQYAPLKSLVSAIATSNNVFAERLAETRQAEIAAALERLDRRLTVSGLRSTFNTFAAARLSAAVNLGL